MPANTVRVPSPRSSVSLTQLVGALHLLGARDAADPQVKLVEVVYRDLVAHGTFLCWGLEQRVELLFLHPAH